jgi:predicted HicB family RNase H-like nuclease
MSTVQKKGRVKTPAEQALERAQEIVASGARATWVDLHNALFGIGGVCVELFPTVSARTAFSKTPEHGQIMKLLENLPDTGLKRPEASGKLLIRIPKSLHAALMVEAEAEDTSVNQLIVAKLSTQLRSVVSM